MGRLRKSPKKSVSRTSLIFHFQIIAELTQLSYFNVFTAYLCRDPLAKKAGGGVLTATEKRRRMLDVGKRFV